MYKSELPTEINNCQYYDKKNRMCSNPNKCNFQETDSKNNVGYVRKERWYEQYYRKNK